MALYLTTPTCHVLFPTCLKCHCCRYLSGKQEMLERTWKHDALHESLAQHLLPDFIWGNSKLLIFSRDWQKTPAFLGVWWRYILSALKAMEACCRFPWRKPKPSLATFWALRLTKGKSLMIKRFDVVFTMRKLSYSASQELSKTCQETGPKVKQATLEVVGYKQFPEAKAFS